MLSKYSCIVMLSFSLFENTLIISMILSLFSASSYNPSLITLPNCDQNASYSFGSFLRFFLSSDKTFFVIDFEIFRNTGLFWTSSRLTFKSRLVVSKIPCTNLSHVGINPSISLLMNTRFMYKLNRVLRSGSKRSNGAVLGMKSKFVKSIEPSVLL